MKNSVYFVILTVLSPVLGLYKSLISLNAKGKLYIFTIFGFFYGMTINYAIGDAGSHVRGLGEYQDYGVNQYVEMLIGIISFKPLPNSPSDLYIHLLNGIAGSIFYSPVLFFAMVGAIYGYFYGRAILKVVSFSNDGARNIGILSFSLITLFVIHRSYGDMQTVRSWTGMWVLFNGVFSYHQTKKKKFLLLIALSPFFHVMYGFIAIPAFVAILAKRIPSYAVIILYLFSFFSNLDTNLVLNSAASVQATDKKLGYYFKTDDSGQELDPIARRRENSQANWYAELGKTDAVYLGSNIFMFFIIVGGFYRKDIMSSLQYGLMTTALLMASLANLLSFAYALYSRTMANASIYILSVLVLLALNGGFGSYKKFNGFSKILLFSGIIVFIPKALYFLSIFLSQSSVFLLIMPFARIFTSELNVTFRDVIDLLL